MNKVVDPGDVLLKRVLLSNKNLKASINPTDQLESFDIYEDMSKPTLYATFLFFDSIGLLENFPIIGEEEISIDFQTPGMSTITTYNFRCFEVTGIARTPNGKGTYFTMRCVSEEHLYNTGTNVSQSYTDVTSNIVPNLLGRYLKSKKTLIMDETKGIQTLIMPNINALQAIDMCRQRSVSKKYPSSAYVFFENQSGFNFKTVEGLIAGGLSSIGSRVFNMTQNPEASKQARADAFRAILQYENITRNDSVEKLAGGVFQAVTKTFDLATKKMDSVDFNLNAVFNKFKLPDKQQIPNTDNFINTFASLVPKTFFAPRDTSRPDNFIDTMIAARNSFTILLNGNLTRVKIHGDTGLKAGDLITLNLPDATGTTDRKGLDDKSAGNYLILRLRHMVTLSTKNQHQIVMDCARMGI